MTTDRATAVAERAEKASERALELRVTDAETRAGAAEMLGGIKALRGEIEATFGPMQRAAHAAWQEVLAQRRRVEKPLTDAEERLKAAIGTWDMEQRRLEQARAAEAAAAARAREEARRIEDAIALVQAGDAVAADALLDEPMPAPPAPIPAAPRPASPAATRFVWRAHVADMRALVKAVAEGRLPEALLVVDGSVLQRLAGAMRAELARVSGGAIAVREEPVVSARSAR